VVALAISKGDAVFSRYFDEKFSLPFQSAAHHTLALLNAIRIQRETLPRGSSNVRTSTGVSPNAGR
jgi:hypothetical protein